MLFDKDCNRIFLLIRKEVNSIANEIKELLGKLEKQGCTIVRTRRGHYKVFLDGKWITTLAGTPSDWRSLRNSLAPLKRAGVRL